MNLDGKQTIPMPIAVFWSIIQDKQPDDLDGYVGVVLRSEAFLSYGSLEALVVGFLVGLPVQTPWWILIRHQGQMVV